MKKLSLLPFVLLLSSISFAGEVNFVASDDSPYTAICIAAADSSEALRTKMEQFAVTRRDIRELSCNSMSLDRFASKYRTATATAQEEPVKVFAFRESTSSNETSLCIAAATSNDEYLRLKGELYSDRFVGASSISCNNMPLRTFARRYGNAEFRI